MLEKISNPTVNRVRIERSATDRWRMRTMRPRIRLTRCRIKFGFYTTLFWLQHYECGWSQEVMPEEVFILEMTATDLDGQTPG